MTEKDILKKALQKVVIAHSLRSKLTLLLDENIECLKEGLTDAGFKVIVIEKGWSDAKIQEIAEGTAIVTKNSEDFIYDAVRCDYDVISIEKIKFIDDKKDRYNLTVKKIATAIRQSRFYLFRGNFLLTILNSGKYTVESLA